MKKRLCVGPATIRYKVALHHRGQPDTYSVLPARHFISQRRPPLLLGWSVLPVGRRASRFPRHEETGLSQQTSTASGTLHSAATIGMEWAWERLT
jgi:hypothetical protein